MKIVIALFAFIFILLQYKLWFDQGGTRQTFKLKKAIVEQGRENQGLYQRNKKLTKRIYHLKHDKYDMELIARKKMGMIKKGEVYYQFTKKGSEERKDDNQSIKKEKREK